VNNLYGVDIMEEATEICKLRLFLKLVSQVEADTKKQNYGIEPLPDIDFNIRAGNTLVGFATKEEVEKAIKGNQQGKLDLFNDMDQIDEKAKAVDIIFHDFKALQSADNTDGEALSAKKIELRSSLAKLNDELDRYLADEYEKGKSKKPSAFQEWKNSHQPFHWFVEFYGIINSGGFNVIIGNPPYVEYSKVQKEYTIKGYKTENAGNLYAFVMELCLLMARHHGYMGMIVQLPMVCTDRMISLQNAYYESSEIIWLSNFDDRPAKLFDGSLEHIRATIAINKVELDNDNLNIYSTNYIRWYSDFRDILFRNVNYADVSQDLMKGSIPKINSEIALNLKRKIKEFKPLQSNLGLGNNLVYFHNAPQYWIRAMDFVPYFWNERDGEKISDHVKSLKFTTASIAKTVVSILNSTIFYWWFIIHSNGRDFNLREIKTFPIGLDTMSSDVKQQLNILADQLMEDFKKNAFRKKATYKTTGEVSYDEFYPKLSKPIIDDIDRILAQHYGFTDEELDFVINYDIKYRIGKDKRGLIPATAPTTIAP